jgi:outer membrane protein OmpA-like peptidoglycan-associated protein
LSKRNANKTRIFQNFSFWKIYLRFQTIKIIFLQIIFLTLLSLNGLYAQTEFPAGDFWALDVGLGMSDILVSGNSYQLVIDPKLWLSPSLMAGAKVGINYSAEEDSSNILTFEGQVYLRWNFLRLGQVNKKVNIFAQAGLGMLAVYRGWGDNVFDDVTRTRGSLLADGAIGVTVPLTQRWHIEALGRGGYPHLFGASITAGYKFPLPEKTKYQKEPGKTEYVEVVKTMTPNEIIKIIKITSIEFIIFGPDIGNYNIGVDRDAQQLNELVLNQIAKDLKENPDFRVRLEGHANPYTVNHSEMEDLMALSAMRANTVAGQLRKRGISDDQITIISYGGTRTATSEWDVRNRNRRVELMVIQIDLNQK